MSIKYSFYIHPFLLFSTKLASATVSEEVDPRRRNLRKTLMKTSEIRDDFLTLFQCQLNQDKHENAKYLVAFNSVGRLQTLKTIQHNIEAHFISSDWTCIVFVYVEEEKIPDTNRELQAISKVCAILRIPGLKWGQWLQIISPTLVSSYERIAIHLDDILLPSTGENKISIPALLNAMEDHNLSSLSPSIAGAGNHYSMHPKIGPTSHCLAEVEMIEVYFQIFTREAWSCFHKQLHHKNGGGNYYDKCYAQHYPGRNAVDCRMIAYHLERAWRQIPADAKIDALNDYYLPKEKVENSAKGGAMSHCQKTIV